MELNFYLEIDCGPANDESFAEKTCTGTSLGSECTYTCISGYQFISGSHKKKCLSSGLWSTIDIKCERKCPYKLWYAIFLMKGNSFDALGSVKIILLLYCNMISTWHSWTLTNSNQVPHLTRYNLFKKKRWYYLYWQVW